MIVAGPDEKDGVQFAAWGELFDCWIHVKHFKYHCYHCTEADETQERNLDVPEKYSDDAGYLWWRSDKRLRADKLGDMVADAAALIVASGAHSLPDGTFVEFDNTDCFKNTLPQ